MTARLRRLLAALAAVVVTVVAGIAVGLAVIGLAASAPAVGQTPVATGSPRPTLPAPSATPAPTTAPALALQMPVGDDCIACHPTTEGGVGTVPVPPIGHPLQGWTACTSCHSNDRLVSTAPGHTGIHADQCLLCHQATTPAAEARPHSTHRDVPCLSCHGTKAPLPESSWVATAAQYDVPIFTSSPGDSSIGMNVAAMKLRGGTTTIDPDLDVLESTAIVYDADVNGVVILGGGSPKNFYLQTQPTLWQILDLNRGGHEYVLQISTDSPQWGGLSGATPSEAISWGKVQANMLHNHVVLYSDSTIGAPIVFSNALSTRKKRPPKRLFARLDALYAKLRKAHQRRHPGTHAMPEIKRAAKKVR